MLTMTAIANRLIRCKLLRIVSQQCVYVYALNYENVHFPLVFRVLVG